MLKVLEKSKRGLRAYDDVIKGRGLLKCYYLTI